MFSRKAEATGYDVKSRTAPASIPVDERVANHRRAIDAAVAAGVSLVAYTSTLQADTAATRRSC
jgi:NAD(P)H dehydrogenase (quinone)